MNYLKDLIDRVYNQQEINQCFILIMDLIDLIKCDNITSEYLVLDEILQEVGDLTKYFRYNSIYPFFAFVMKYYIFRHTWKNSNSQETKRNYYIILLSLICRLVQIRNNDKNIKITRESIASGNVHKKVYDPVQFASASFNTTSASFNTSSDHLNLSNQQNVGNSNLNSGQAFIWQQELEMALYDYPLEQVYPNIYEDVFNALHVIYFLLYLIILLV